MQGVRGGFEGFRRQGAVSGLRVSGFRICGSDFRMQFAKV